MLQNRGIYFHISWFFAYIRTADRQTGETYGTTGKGLDILHGLDQDFDVMEHPQSVIHILCTRESMNFRFQNINYNIVAGDYVILANMSLASGFSEKELPLSEIAAGMNFSSFSYFSRYVSRHFGISHTMSTGSH